MAEITGAHRAWLTGGSVGTRDPGPAAGDRHRLPHAGGLATKITLGQAR